MKIAPFKVAMLVLAGALVAAGCGESRALHDLAIALAGPENIRPGSMVTYEITVTNAGRTPALNVVVDSRTPAGLLFLYNSGSCPTSFPCSIGTLNPGATRTITSRYSIPVTYPGMDVVRHEAVVFGTFQGADESYESDGRPKNDLAVVETPLLLDAPPTKRGRSRRPKR